jgi:hypothetical protein
MSSSQYYRPYSTDYDEYQSGNSSGSDSDSDSDSESSSYENTIARGTDDPRYAIIRAAGPSLNTVNEQLYYQKGTHTENVGYAYSDWSPNITNNTVHKDTIGNFYPAARSSMTTLFSIDSTNRDINAYPHSTYFTLKTPRTYKNITQIQIININFPYFLNQQVDISSVFFDVANWVSSNYNIQYDKCAGCLGQVGLGGVTSSLIGGSFSEYGRISPSTQTNPLVHTFTLGPGDYSGPLLASELNKQMNLTPPFNIISYAEHRHIFLATKTVDHLFNKGGKWYYSVSTKSYVQNASREFIRNDYIPQVILVDPTNPTEREIFVAYFYPVLKRAFASLFDHKFLDFGTHRIDEVRNRVMTFEGVSSPLYYELTYANRDTLKSMRRQGTFEYAPIHDYTWHFNPNLGKLSVQHTDLHPSLRDDIQISASQHQYQEMSALGYTPTQFRNLQIQSQRLSAVVNDLTNTMNRALNTYLPSEAFANPDTMLPSACEPTDEALFALAEGRSLDVIGSRSIRSHLEGATSFDDRCLLTRAGGNTIPDYMGVDVSCSNFKSLYSTFLTYYSTSTGIGKDIQTVHTNSLNTTSNFVNHKYNTVLPASLLSNNAYLNNKGTGGVTFYGNKLFHLASTPAEVQGQSLVPADVSCCAILNAALNNFYGCLPANYVINTVTYKLGLGTSNILNFYNTEGLNKVTTTRNIYLQMNLEQPLNRLDVGGKENFNISNETTSSYHLMMGKIPSRSVALTPGSIMTTIIQAPAKFDMVPLASLDHFTFRFYLDDMVPLDLLYPFKVYGTDWDAVIQIDEQIGTLPLSNK